MNFIIDKLFIGGGGGIFIKKNHSQQFDNENTIT